MANKDFGEYVRKLRTERTYSLKQLADEIENKIRESAGLPMIGEEAESMFDEKPVAGLEKPKKKK